MVVIKCFHFLCTSSRVFTSSVAMAEFGTGLSSLARLEARGCGFALAIGDFNNCRIVGCAGSREKRDEQQLSCDRQTCIRTDELHGVSFVDERDRVAIIRNGARLSIRPRKAGRPVQDGSVVSGEGHETDGQHLSGV